MGDRSAIHFYVMIVSRRIAPYARGLFALGREALQELAQGGFGRNDYGSIDLKTIGGLVRQVDHHLEGLERLGLALEKWSRFCFRPLGWRAMVIPDYPCGSRAGAQ